MQKLLVLCEVVLFLVFWLKQRKELFRCKLHISLFSGPPEQGPLGGYGGCLLPGLTSENRDDFVLDIVALVPCNTLFNPSKHAAVAYGAGDGVWGTAPRTGCSSYLK